VTLDMTSFIGTTSAEIFAAEIYNRATENCGYLWKKKFKKTDDRVEYIFDSIVDLFKINTASHLSGIREAVLDNLYEHIYAGLT